MSLPLSAPASSASRVYAIVEWLLVLGFLAIVAWTTLCLGGYLAQTMIVSGTVVLGLGALGALLWATGQGGCINLAVLLPVPFLLYALASVVWQAPAQWLAWREWLLWFQMWLGFALLLHFGRGRNHTRVIVLTIAALAVAGVGMAVYQRFSDASWMMLGRKQAVQYAGRSSGMFAMPNSLAAFLELLVPLCLTLAASRAVRPGLKVFSCWLAILLVFALGLTVSRGGWLSLGLALLIWPLLAGRTWRKKITGAAVIFGCALGGLWLLYHNSDNARQRIQPFLNGEYEMTRPMIWKAGHEIWQGHPWFGTGAGSFNMVFDQYRPGGFRDEPLWTHNDYLNTLSDYGLAGFALWAGAGVALFALGLLTVKRMRRAGTASPQVFELAKGKLGLFLGLLAYAIHLCVDFHTKIPALAFLSAIGMALLLRDEAALRRSVHPLARWCGGVLLGLVSLGLAWGQALPLYRAEALRFEASASIDHYARTKRGDLGRIASLARNELTRAVRIDPKNGQAWSDLSYATVLSSSSGGDLVALGRFAELAADKALKLCPVAVKFWIRKGIALDAQGGRPEAEECFRRAVELAPKSAPAWYAYAYHLQAFPKRQDDARAALETCLTLDPYYPPAEGLRQQLVPSH